MVRRGKCRYQKFIQISCRYGSEKLRTIRFILFYSQSDSSKRESGWNLLRILKNHNYLPCLVSVDFNEVLRLKEVSSARRNRAMMTRFSEALDDCNSTDLGFQGIPFNFLTKGKGRKRQKQDHTDQLQLHPKE